ncbi:glycosyltransferase family 2 protein [Desulfobacca acetoxidans]|uniref:Glycosyl transferase family 2 n=1 Tax=Desulfobacca acetoxidans (strain ATCC 700848 / DSM 11109 / ASRB2) TaxID=880072 RepID=F2NJJ0_DESAR|nr:glycosyltransferase family 2 protein [Desulfobacca acetoxidans]AEB09502.1 glycosyl transferase family 2 [Desulfobacca acetoxidans DSM 11109]
MAKAPVSVIILTYNEEVNIRACLQSAKDLTDEIFIVDSFSTDQTLNIARAYTEKIYQNAWVHWADQRNWALDNLPLKTDWVLFLDADERLTPELCQEISETLAGKANPSVQGYYIKRNFYFLGRWLKHGGYKADYILRLIKKQQARILKRGAWEYATVQGELGYLNYPMRHEDARGLTYWIAKHNNYAIMESHELVRLDNKAGLTNEAAATNQRKIEHKFKIWLREKIWVRMPLFIRPLFYFFYRYIVQLGFLDGKEGLIYCFLHGLWYPFLVDAKYLELKKRNSHSGTSPCNNG